MTYCIASVFCGFLKNMRSYEEHTFIQKTVINNWSWMYLHIYRIKHIATTLKTDLYQLIGSVLDPVAKMNFQFVLLVVLSKKKELLMIFAINFFSVFRIISFSDKLLRKQNWSRNFMASIITRFGKFDRISQSKIFVKTDFISVFKIQFSQTFIMELFWHNN